MTLAADGWFDSQQLTAAEISREEFRGGANPAWLASMHALFASPVRRYRNCMKTTVSSKSQIVLPAEFRQMDRIEPGQEFDVERVDRGDYRLVRRAAPRNEGAIDWLLVCPQKDFFVPIDSESTDAL